MISFKYLFLVVPLLLIQPSNPIALKYALEIGWSPYLLGALRMSMISGFFMIWVWLVQDPLFGVSSRRHWILFAAMCKGIGIFCFFHCLNDGSC